MHFYTKSKHLMTLKIKDKNYNDETVFQTIVITRKLEFQGSFVYKGSG